MLHTIPKRESHIKFEILPRIPKVTVQKCLFPHFFLERKIEMCKIYTVFQNFFTFNH